MKRLSFDELQSSSDYQNRVVNEPYYEDTYSLCDTYVGGKRGPQKYFPIRRLLCCGRDMVITESQPTPAQNPLTIEYRCSMCATVVERTRAYPFSPEDFSRTPFKDECIS